MTLRTTMHTPKMESELAERVLDLAVAIQQIPSPTFGEGRRAAFVCERFQAEGLSDVSMDALGNVYGRLAGKGTRKPLVVSAHLDTVFPEGTPLDLHRESEKVYGPGLGDNALGVAGLFGLLWALQQRAKAKPRSGTDLRIGPKSLPGDIWLVANVGEEGLGNLRGMTAVVDRFGKDVRGYVVLEGMALGQVYHRGMSVQRYQIEACTAGGHAWVDFGQPSAIHELAGLITRLCALPLPNQPRSSMNIGVISGGMSVNTIAAQASCLLDLRSEDHLTLTKLAALVQGLVEAGNRPGVQFSWEIVGVRPAGEIPLDHPLIVLALHSLEALGIQPLPNIGSTDANVPLSRGLPAVCVGLTTGGGAHTLEEYINTPLLGLGLSQLLALVDGIFQGE